MINQIVYVSVPYNLKNPCSQLLTVLEFQRFYASYIKRYPEFTPVNALMSTYNNPELTEEEYTSEKHVYSVAKKLIDSADLFLVLRLKGWELSDIVMQELAYATVKGKVTVYEDTY